MNKESRQAAKRKDFLISVCQKPITCLFPLIKTKGTIYQHLLNSSSRSTAHVNVIFLSLVMFFFSYHAQ